MDKLISFVFGKFKKLYYRARGYSKRSEDAMAYYQMRFSSSDLVPVLLSEKRTQPLIVTLTTLPDRIHTVYLTIESIFNQSIKPDRIILWIDKNRFTIKELPATLKKQMDRGLEVRLCEDMGPHTKLIPAFLSYPEALLVTADDDMLYPPKWLGALYEAHQNEPYCIFCHRAHRIRFNHHMAPRPYLFWGWNIKAENGYPSFDLFPTGVGGVLYFPGSLDMEVVNQNKFKTICPKADDIWFKGMSLKARVKCAVVKNQARVNHGPFSEGIYPIPEKQTDSLNEYNILKRGNDSQIKGVWSHLSSDIRSLVHKKT